MIRTNHWHGGIIATILDSVGGAIGIANFNSSEDKLSTIDLRVDYLRFADGNDLVFEGKLVRMGNRIMVTKMKAFHPYERFIAFHLLQDNLIERCNLQLSQKMVSMAFPKDYCL